MMDPLASQFGQQKELRTKEKMLLVLDEVELIYDTMLALLASQPFARDPSASAYLAAAGVAVPAAADQCGSCGPPKNAKNPSPISSNFWLNASRISRNFQVIL